MADNFSVARPYAKSIFELAQKNNQNESWELILKILAQAVEDSTINMLVKNPEITPSQLSNLLISIFPEITWNKSVLKQEVTNFVNLLIEKKRLLVVPEINHLFQALLAEHQKLANVEVISAFTINKDQKQQLHAALNQRFQKSINLNYRTDESLIGGAIIRSGNWVVDGSVKGKLQRLHEELQK